VPDLFLTITKNQLTVSVPAQKVEQKPLSTVIVFSIQSVIGWNQHGEDAKSNTNWNLPYILDHRLYSANKAWNRAFYSKITSLNQQKVGKEGCNTSNMQMSLSFNFTSRKS